jgi:ribosomal protein S18 acetylase RimI-like enzyme
MYNSCSGLNGTLGVPTGDAGSHSQWFEACSRAAGLIADVNGEAAGHLVLIPTGGAVQMTLWVHPSFRRKGVGTALVRAAIRDTSRDDFHYIWTMIAHWNTSAKKLLDQLGFRVIWQDAREMQFMRRVAT